MKKIKDVPEFVDGINAADTEEIKAKVMVCEGHLYEIDNDKMNNAKLQELSAELKEMTKPYADAKSLEMAKIKYCIYTLQSRGVKI